MYWPADNKATVLKKGDKVKLRYRVLTHAGNAQQADINALYEEYKKE
jgi:hypothetical protein